MNILLSQYVLEIRKFFREERIYAWLLIGLLLIYAGLLVFRGKDREEEVSPALAKVKQVEQMLKEQGAEREELMLAVSQHPRLTFVLGLFALLSSAGIAAGLVLDAVFLGNLLGKRETIKAVRSPEPAGWGLTELVKTIMLFISFGMAAGLVLGGLQKIFFKQWEDNFLILFHTTLSDLMLLMIILYFVIKKYGRSPASIWFSLKTWRQDIVLGFLGYWATLPVFLAVLLILMGIVTFFSYEPPPHPLVEVFLEEDKRNPFLIGYSLFLACVMGPVIEEIFFRGFCYPALKKKWGVKRAMILTAAFFAWIHQSGFAFVPIFVLGLVLAYLYEKRGTLLPSICMHVLHNSIFIGYFFLMKKIFLDKFLT